VLFQVERVEAVLTRVVHFAQTRDTARDKRPTVEQVKETEAERRRFYPPAINVDTWHPDEIAELLRQPSRGKMSPEFAKKFDDLLRMLRIRQEARDEIADGARAMGGRIMRAGESLGIVLAVGELMDLDPEFHGTGLHRVSIGLPFTRSAFTPPEVRR
jgi:hypothetical protein